MNGSVWERDREKEGKKCYFWVIIDNALLRLLFVSQIIKTYILKIEFINISCLICHFKAKKRRRRKSVLNKSTIKVFFHVYCFILNRSLNPLCGLCSCILARHLMSLSVYGVWVQLNESEPVYAFLIWILNVLFVRLLDWSDTCAPLHSYLVASPIYLLKINCLLEDRNRTMYKCAHALIGATIQMMNNWKQENGKKQLKQILMRIVSEKKA